MSSRPSGTSSPRAVAEQVVEAASNSPERRVELAARFYDADPEYSRFGRGELSFIRWLVERGVLGLPSTARGSQDSASSSAWWRALNSDLLCDKIEASHLRNGELASSHAVELWRHFLHSPNPRSWFRAHNASVVQAYLRNEHLAMEELVSERFVMNVALLRALYAQALVEQPALVAGAPLRAARHVGDPRRGAIRVFLNLRRAFPQRYPLTGMGINELVAAEGAVARIVDHGLIAPRAEVLVEFAATSLGIPGVRDLVDDGLPAYGGLSKHVAISTWARPQRRIDVRLVRRVTGT